MSKGQQNIRVFPIEFGEHLATLVGMRETLYSVRSESTPMTSSVTSITIGATHMVRALLVRLIRPQTYHTKLLVK